METKPTATAIEPPHPALRPVKNETLRLLMAEEEGGYIAQQTRLTKRRIAIAVAVGALAPLMPVALYWDNAYWFEWAIESHALLGVAAGVGLLAGLAAPLWAMVRIGFEIAALRRYKAYAADHTAFLARHNRCPLPEPEPEPKQRADVS